MSHSVLRTTRLWPIAEILFLSGCASATPANGGWSTGQSVRVSDAQGGDRMNTAPALEVAQRSMVQVPIAEAWVRLSKAYADLGIPLTTMQPAVHELGNQGMRRTHSLGNKPLSSMLECGTSADGTNADIYLISMSVVTQLTATADSTTEVATFVQATASPMAFSSPPIACSTKGSLEARISSMVSGAAVKN